MKKLLNMLCSALLVMSCVVMLGCTSEKKDVSNSKYIGTWKAVSAEALGQKVSADEMFEGGEVVIEFKGDGTGTMTDNENNKSTFTWVETSKGPKTSGDVNVAFEENEDGQLVGNVAVAKLYFEKQ